MEDRQCCFDYLLGDLESSARKRFEVRVRADDAIAEELKRCESDLARFAEASAPDIAPPAYLLDGILEEARPKSISVEWTVPSHDEPKRRIPWGVIWGAAASVLLAVNLWQWRFAETDERIAETKIENTNVARESIFQKKEETLRGEIIELLAQIETMHEQFEEVAEKGEALVLAQSAREALQVERDRLVERIELLETSYLGLIEISEPYLRLLAVSDTADPEETEVDETSEDDEVSVAEDSFGIWQTLSERMGENTVLALNVSYRRIEVGSDGSSENAQDFEDNRFVISNVAPAISDSYALATTNEESGHAILSLGNIPFSPAGDNMVIWARNLDTDSVSRVGILPRFAQGASADIALRLPEGFEASNDFLVTLETPRVDDQSVPSERIVLETFVEP